MKAKKKTVNIRRKNHAWLKSTAKAKGMKIGARADQIITEAREAAG